jgi:hypothetical protein
MLGFALAETTSAEALLFRVVRKGGHDATNAAPVDFCPTLTKFGPPAGGPFDSFKAEKLAAGS